MWEPSGVAVCPRLGLRRRSVISIHVDGDATVVRRVVAHGDGAAGLELGDVEAWDEAFRAGGERLAARGANLHVQPGDRVVVEGDPRVGNVEDDGARGRAGGLQLFGEADAAEAPRQYLRGRDASRRTTRLS